MAHVSSDDEEIVGINVTPLVDITLVLLIVFMVTAKLVMAQALPLDLPKAASAGEVQSVFAVVIDANGRMTVDGRALEDDAVFRRAVRTTQRNTSELRAVISASERVSHGRVMHALDLLREEGVVKIAFAAEKAR